VDQRKRFAIAKQRKNPHVQSLRKPGPQRIRDKTAIPGPAGWGDRAGGGGAALKDCFPAGRSVDRFLKQRELPRPAAFEGDARAVRRPNWRPIDFGIEYQAGPPTSRDIDGLDVEILPRPGPQRDGDAGLVW
jgi:hypothetical protein